LLVVEDNIDDQELLRHQMKKANIHDRVFFVDNGTAAMKCLTEDTFRSIFAVFLDLNLAGQSGLEVLRFIRSTPDLSLLPVIVMTGSENPRDLTECRRLNATSYAVKPIDFKTFCTSVASVFHLPTGKAAIRKIPFTGDDLQIHPLR
jgi:CheY-like chemotaxis protein